MFSEAATPQKRADILPAPVPDLLLRSVLLKSRSCVFPKKRVVHLAIHIIGEEKMEHFLFRASPNPMQGLHNSHLQTQKVKFILSPSPCRLFPIFFQTSSKCATQYSTTHGTVQVLVTSFLIKTKEPTIQKPPNGSTHFCGPNKRWTRNVTKSTAVHRKG